MLRRILTDIIIWIAATGICIFWRLIQDKEQIWSYVLFFLVMMLIWIVCGIILRKYTCSYKENKFRTELSRLLSLLAVMLGLIYYVVPQLNYGFSSTVATWMVCIVFLINLLLIVCQHYWKYAQNMDTPELEIEQRTDAQLKRADEQRSESSQQTIHDAVLSITTEKDYQLLHDKADLDSRLTKVVANIDVFSVMQLPQYQYRTIVDLTLLNNMRGINNRFCIVNQKLPDEGRYVCCYRSQEWIKEKIFTKYPKGINWIIYSVYFFNKRVLPRLLLTARAYFDVTQGHKRMLSKTEVLGRLYYCGFAVDEVVSIEHIDYVFAHRTSQPYPQTKNKLYGPIIKLSRIGKDGKMVDFYKFRTMHPYSEYIQDYVFDQSGGMDISDKSNNDWRITSWGKVFRRYWIDELPMLINWIKGDCKLVGVRPLSRSMYNKYPKALQEKRIRCKPGLIPPFYIDHPTTFDELFESENKYLDEYLQHPLRTDIKYFFLTIYSIFFRRMHSA